MAAAATLDQASKDAFKNLLVQYTANTLPPALLLFASDCAPVFLDAHTNDRPIGDWLAIIAAYGKTFPTAGGGPGQPAVSNVQYSTAAKAVFSICNLAAVLNALTLITNAQAAAMLAAYNLRFG